MNAASWRSGVCLARNAPVTIAGMLALEFNVSYIATSPLSLRIGVWVLEPPGHLPARAKALKSREGFRDSGFGLSLSRSWVREGFGRIKAYFSNAARCVNSLR
jgi:hypothetical protein